MASVTIFTPTFNRAYILPKLYESLCRQNCKDFVWLIVDDGSTDNTKELVDSWIAEAKIAIRYFHQENGGKMRAHNLGVHLCDTPLFLCVDSDDYMTDSAINDILVFWAQNYHKEKNICGLIAYRAMVKRREAPQILKRFPPVRSCTMHALMNKHKHCGETSIIFLTEVLKKFPFPEIDGEKFVTEAYIYDQIDQYYETLLFDKDIVVCEYLPDGYTKSRATIYKIAPKGWAMYYNQQCRLWNGEYTFKEKIKAITYYIIMSQIGGDRNIYQRSNDKSFRYLIAWVIAPYYKMKLKRIINL